jgi:hypothetical protein
MPETKPPQRLSFECPAVLAEALETEATQRGVALEELIADLVVTPLSDQLAELHLSRLDR